MKFITEKQKSRKLTFSQVEANQFFVDKDGDLCHKINASLFNVIARKGGIPRPSISLDISPDAEIERICEKVTKIEF